MSDQPSPPKSKPGSLRDRIAAFEKPSTSTNAPPPIASRPKAGQVSWKPKQATPPESPAAEETSIPQPKKFGGGMSATDAKESIGKGVSLKERMAALQGKGAFGASPPPIAPKPAIEKPKWKPPPTVALPPDDDDNEEKEVFVEKSEQVLSTPALGEQGPSQLEERTEPTAEEGDAEDDPQEEERKRRAALAARMARLGGARVGMGAPVFGGSAYKKPQPKFEPDTPKEVGLEPTKAEVSELGLSTSTPEAEAEGTKKEIERKASDASSLLSHDTSSSPSISPRTPNYMPVPAAPRRAAPPRRKAPKSPAPPPVEEPEFISDAIGDKEPKGGEVSISADSVPVDEEVPTKVLDNMVDDVPPEPFISVEPPMVISVEETPISTIKTDFLETEISNENPLVTAQQQVEEPEIAHDETEEEEVARRKRVAERLAKSGGVNPFAPSSQRKQTLSTESSEESPAPPTPERTSFRKSSADSASNLFSPPPVRRPSTKPSMDSVMSRDIISHDDDISSPARPAISEEPEQSLSLEEADIAEQKVHEELDDEYLDQEAEAFGARSRFEEAPREVAAPPLPAASTRPVPAGVEQTYVPPHASHAVVPEYEPEDDESEPAPPPPPRRSMPPPPPQLAEDEEEANTFPPQHVEPPRRLPPRPIVDDEGDMSDAPLPHLSRRSIPPPPPEEVIEDDQMSDYEPKPIPVSYPTRSFPPPPVKSMSQEVEEIDEEEDELKESTEEILPTPPRRVPSLEQQEEPLFIPPPPPKSANTVASIAQRRASQQVENVKLPPPPAVDPREQIPVSTPTLSVSDHSGDEQKGSEILDEEDGDPIDPSFYSPPSRRASALETPVTPEPESEQEQEPVEDEDQVRRRTIAERMAKLGGIRFGAAPVPAPRPPPPRRQESEEGNQGEGGVEGSADDQPELTEEEEERARKERIAAKMATMGGMRIGMQPFGVGMLPGKAPAPPARQSSSSSIPQQPPRYAAPPPPPPPQDVDSEYESLSTSDEGVRVEAEESEMEEVNYEDAQEEQEEVAPPPVPAREGRRSSGQYMPSSGRPPVPITVPSRKSSAQTETAPVPTPRKSSASQPLPPSSSEYVMVEGSDDDFAPPPPPRASRPAPPRAAPVPPAPVLPSSESISSQWEMPSIPSIDFGGNAELSLSWTDDMASSISSVQPPSEPPSQTKTTATSNQALNSDDLIAVWGKVGVHICEVATNLHEKSKKTLIGDGTYRGFIDAALREVPNAASVSGQDYGYLIYMQSGASVQKRASEILPGDIVWMHEAKFKGHKGLQNYSQNVEELVGVVFEFEAKKFKIRVFQANQHVGQQTVESVSYRLEDLKNGIVKIFRVLEA